MKRSLFLILISAFNLLQVISQEVDPSWGIKFSGFIKNDIFYDTRQSTASNGLREGHFYLYPDNSVFDINGKDINANPSLHFLSIQTRIREDIKGPDAFGAKTSGVIEAEFFGTSEADLNGFRLRHAYVKLDWPKTTLLSGQFWHPMFIAESFPGTISFNTGAPFTPFSRNPQVKLTQMIGKADVSLTAYGQRDFTSPGPDGNSNRYLRNSHLPGLNLQMRIPAGDIITAWLGFDYKKLRPEIRTALNYETDAAIGSFAVVTNIKIKTSPLNMSIMAVFAQNASDLMMTGGYAVSSIDLLNLIKSYTTINTGSIWMDMSTNGKKTSFGLFTGLSGNLGAGDQIEGAVYGRGTDIKYLFRIAPRIIVTGGKFSFAGEIENTTAAYGTMQSDGKVINADNVSNLRILLSTIYKF
jgi:hypothetical protein